MSDATGGSRRGRPPKYLLSGIAVCGVCRAPLRVGGQNAGSSDDRATRYRVYECGGRPGRTGFHVVIHQEHLDQIVVAAVLARVGDPSFQTPRALPDDADGAERQALRLEIKSRRIWLTSVWKEARRRAREDVADDLQGLVLQQNQEAQRRIDELERANPEIGSLRDSPSRQATWDALPIGQKRDIVQTLMIPTVNPVPGDQRGARGLDSTVRRVELQWRVTSS